MRDRTDVLLEILDGPTPCLLALASLALAAQLAAAQTTIKDPWVRGTVPQQQATGKPVDLKPGGYHVMLMGPKQPLKDGETVPLTRVVEGKDGKQEKLDVKAAVRTGAAK